MKLAIALVVFFGGSLPLFAYQTLLECVRYTEVARSRHVLAKSVDSDKVDTIQRPEKVFIFGLGYVGSMLADRLVQEGFQVAGTCTNVNKALKFREQGINTYLFDEISIKRGQIEAAEDLLASNYILSTVPPFGDGVNARDLVLEAHADDLRRSALTGGGLKWVGYLSSTGVYGECEGAWVREERKINPENDKTIARAKCELRWRQLEEKSGLPVHTFRLAGIYGPERSALDTLLDTLQDKGGFPPADDVTFISRIHVEDIIQVLLASMKNPTPGEIYNVADDLPSTRFDVLSYAGMLAGASDILPSKLAASRGGSKRVSNMKMKALLAKNSKSLLYPDYRSGLSTLWSSYQQKESFRPLQSAAVAVPPTSTALSSAAANRAKSSVIVDSQYSSSEIISRINSLEERMERIEQSQKSITDAINQMTNAKFVINSRL